MDIFELPPIEGGSDKQKIYAEGVRLQYLNFIETELDPKHFDDALIVAQVRIGYKWWIDRAKKIDEKSIKTMISGAKASITRAGSVAGAIEAQRETMRKQAEKYLEYLKYLQERDQADMDYEIEDEVSMDGQRERPF